MFAGDVNLEKQTCSKSKPRKHFGRMKNQGGETTEEAKTS